MLQSLENLNSKVFSENLRSKFKVHLQGQEPVVLELAEVTDGKCPPHVELFFLIFHGPAARLLAQQIHRLEHEKLGMFEIFLTPIASEAQSISYEAVFHRMRKKDK